MGENHVLAARRLNVHKLLGELRAEFGFGSRSVSKRVNSLKNS